MHAILSATPALFVLGLSMHSASPVQAQPLGIGPVETVPLGGTSDQPSGGSSSKDREPAQGREMPRPKVPSKDELRRVKALPGAPMTADPALEQKAGQKP
jgi:hypothetical protein